MKNSFLKKSIQPAKGISVVSPIAVPGPVYATTGSLPGEIFLQWDSINSARKYVIEISSTISEKWQQVDIIKDPLYCITGLKSATEYYFRVAAIYPEGVGPWSKTVSKRSK